VVDVDCPVCGETASIGVPHDAAITAVSSEPGAEPNESDETKTRRIRCPDGHRLYVTFG
jgi:hypothetical protein